VLSSPVGKVGQVVVLLTIKASGFGGVPDSFPSSYAYPLLPGSEVVDGCHYS
jgi:hypothetical protein